MGLCLGFSLLIVVELINFFTNVACFGRKGGGGGGIQNMVMPERIYNSHYGNGVPAMFTS